MRHTLRYIIFALALMIPALAWAQQEDPGARLHKEVLGQNSDGSYTLRLESYATGETEVEMNDVPSDVVLILDLSTSMGGHRTLEQMDKTTLSYNDVVNNPDGKVYFRWDQNDNYAYQIFGLERTVNGQKRYYLYWIQPSVGILFLNNQGIGPDYYRYSSIPSGTTIPANERFSRSSWPSGTLVATSDRNYTQSDNGGYYLRATYPNAGIRPINQPDGYDVTKFSDSTYDNLFQSTTTGIAYATSMSDPIVTNAVSSVDGVTTIYKGTSRLSELQSAVCEFIDQIDDNDKNKVNADGSVSERNPRLGNKLSILVFAGNAFGNNSYKVIQSLEAIGNLDIDDLKSDVNAFTLASGTKPKDAFVEANSQLSNAGSGHTKTIVFFTDGQADDQGDVVSNAKTCKDNNTTVYSIAMFGSALGSTSEPYIMLQRVSSNYPNATGMGSGQAGTGGSDDAGYFFDVSEEGNLSQVFTKIAGNITSGSSNPSIEAHTRVSDGITSSFRVPNGFDASKVVVYTVDHDPEEEDGWYPIPTHSVPATTSFGNAHVHQLTVVTSGTDYLTDDSKVLVSIIQKDGRDYVLVEGFDYAKDDTSIGAGDGNWVGRRYKNGEFFYAGKKLVIEFNIVATDNTTGGDNTQTNTSDSGLFIWNEETGGYDPLVRYEVPNADIPINIVIKKRGLRHGESATIQIYWAPQSTEYNTTTGKLNPDLTTPWFGNSDGGWGNFSKVILTNKGDDGAEVVETLLCLDPKYVYMLVEDDWGWAYNLVNDTLDTSKQVDNPFIFVNEEKSNTVKHAEAATINRFGENLYGKERTETVKSSKVESFTVPTE